MESMTLNTGWLQGLKYGDAVLIVRYFTHKKEYRPIARRTVDKVTATGLRVSHTWYDRATGRDRDKYSTDCLMPPEGELLAQWESLYQAHQTMARIQAERAKDPRNDLRSSIIATLDNSDFTEWPLETLQQIKALLDEAEASK